MKSLSFDMILEKKMIEEENIGNCPMEASLYKGEPDKGVDFEELVNVIQWHHK